jgi:hypothetical protein
MTEEIRQLNMVEHIDGRTVNAERYVETCVSEPSPLEQKRRELEGGKPLHVRSASHYTKRMQTDTQPTRPHPPNHPHRRAIFGGG